jgi:hypothetical protein
METLIQDEGFRHYFFSEIPHLIDELPLSGPAHRLYCHYKRRTGEDPKGACWESTEKTAKLLRMSKSTVCRARKELAKWHLISIEKIDRGHGEYLYCSVSILNIWSTNIEIYSVWSREKRDHYFEAARKFGIDEVFRMNREGS